MQAPPDARQAIGGAVQTQVDPYDFGGDPLLNRIKAIGLESRAHAQAEAARAQADLDREYGVGAEGEANPFSILRRLAERERTAPGQLDEQLGANLFYGGYRGTKQSELAQSLLQARTTAAGQYRTGSESIAGNLREALLDFDRRDAEAAEDAAERRREQLGELDFGPSQGARESLRRVGRVPRPARPARQHRPRPVRAIYE